MKTFTHLLCVLILSIALFACNNAHFLKEEAYRNQVIQDFELKKQALPHGDLFAIFAAVSYTHLTASMIVISEATFSKEVVVEKLQVSNSVRWLPTCSDICFVN